MKEIVRKDPAKAVKKAIFEVRKYAAELYANDEVFYLRIIEELGDDKALTEMLYQVRLREIGPTPKNRNEFDPNILFDENFQENNDIIIMDSNDLKEGWKEEITKRKENSRFQWENLNENLRKYEDEDEGFQDDNESKKDCEMCLREEVHDCSVKETVNDPSNENVKDNTKKSIPKEAEMSKDLPKRLLGYTSKRLLQLLTKHVKTSMDGTFKSCCKLWSQQFIWMVKIKGMSRETFFKCKSKLKCVAWYWLLVVCPLKPSFNINLKLQSLQGTGFLLSGDGYLIRQNSATRSLS